MSNAYGQIGGSIISAPGIVSQPPLVNSSVIISTDNLSVAGAFTITIDTSLPVDASTFTVGDITVSNGSKSSFTQVTTQNFTCVITPTSSGSVIISVSNNVFTSSGFGNQASNTLTVTYSSGGINARIFAIFGQSNVIPGGITAATVSSYLLGSQSYAKIWNSSTSSWDVITAGTTTGYWPVIAFVYYLHARYPSDEIYIVQKGVSGTYLATQWGQGTTYYNDLLSQWNAAIATIASTRNFLEKSTLFIQGEADSKGSTFASSYQANESNLKTAVRTDFGTTKFIDADIYYLLPSATYPYSATVRTAKQNLVSGDANFKLLDASTWSHQADNTHLDGSGIESLGYNAAQQ